MQIEIAVQDAAGAVIARDGGADRVELCAALELGGTTPSAGIITTTVAAVGPDFPVHVLIRPRPGDFCYRDDELETMLADVSFAVDAGAAGVVIGQLRRDGDRLVIDERALDRLVAAAGGGSVTFHRAFDLVDDPERAVGTLAGAGVGRILTSGGAPDAHQGIPTLTRLVAVADGRLEVMAGGGVRADALHEFVAAGVDAAHLSAKRVRSELEGLPIGSAVEAGVSTWFETDPAVVAQAVAGVRSSS